MAKTYAYHVIIETTVIETTVLAVFAGNSHFAVATRVITKKLENQFLC